jgi:Xaa-Pro aminopeptidase
MVFTIEPGLDESDVGGFRHSDTVIVAETGSTSSPLTRRTSRA